MPYKIILDKESKPGFLRIKACDLDKDSVNSFSVKLGSGGLRATNDLPGSNLKLSINIFDDATTNLIPVSSYVDHRGRKIGNGSLTDIQEFIQEFTEALGDPQQGPPGNDGQSAYELAVTAGFVGTIDEWLLSLKVKGDPGNDGDAGKSAYELAVDTGYVGTLEEWLLSLKSSSDKYLGRFNTVAELELAFPTPELGDFAYIVETKSMWTYDSVATVLFADAVVGQQYESGKIVSITPDKTSAVILADQSQIPQMVNPGDFDSWSQYMAYVDSFALDGHDDWRAPNLEEIHMIASVPAGTATFGYQEYSEYWTSVELDVDNALAYTIADGDYSDETYNNGIGYSVPKSRSNLFGFIIRTQTSPSGNGWSNNSSVNNLPNESWELTDESDEQHIIKVVVNNL